MTVLVAYLCADPGVPVFGTKGASVHVQEIVRAFRARGADVRLYATRLGDHRPADLADLPVTHVPVSVPKGERRTATREAAQARAAAVLAAAAVADGADLVYERYSLFSDALATVTDVLQVPGVLEVNSPLIEEQATHRDLVDAAGAHRVLRRQVAAATSVACVSEPVAAWVRRRCPTARAGDHREPAIVVAPNGVNTDRIVPVTADPADPVVLFVGTLKPWHGTDLLLEAAALAERPWRLRIVGDGPQRAALAAQADRLGLSVDFRGAVPPADVPAALAGASLAVAPYPATADEQYFSPLKIYEYAAAGLPVVASRVGQIPAIVEDGGTGLLVPPSDPAALAEAVDTLVADPRRAAAMGRAGRERMVRDHSWTAVLGRCLAPLGDRGRAA